MKPGPYEHNPENPPNRKRAFAHDRYGLKQLDEEDLKKVREPNTMKTSLHDT
jgi:hypothetical protein